MNRNKVIEDNKEIDTNQIDDQNINDQDEDIDENICIIDKSLYESEEYQNILNIKKIASYCVRFASGYLLDLVVIIIIVAINIWLSYKIDDPAIQERFWAVIVFLIITGIVLIWADIILIIKAKKLKEFYPDKIKNLWILYLVGLFTIIPSIIAAIITNSVGKKILDELDKKEKTYIRTKKSDFFK